MHETFAQRLAFIGLDEGTETQLAPLSASLEAHLGPALDRLQVQAARMPASARFLFGRERIEGSPDSMAAHWRALVSGRYDEDFLTAAQRMGHRHARIGLEPRWQVGSYKIVLDTLVKGLLHDGIATALPGRRGGLAWFGAGEQARLVTATEAIADGLSALLGGVFLGLDVSLSAYVDKLRDEQQSAIEAQRRRLRQAVAKAGAALDLAAEGRVDPDLQAATDPDMAPLHEGAARLADTVIALVGELETAGAALRSVAHDVVQQGRSMVAVKIDHVEKGEAVAAQLGDRAEAAKSQAVAATCAGKRLRSLARQCAEIRKAQTGLGEMVAALRPAAGEDEMDDQLDGLVLSLQLMAANRPQTGGGADDLAQLSGVVAALGRLSAQLRVKRSEREETLAQLEAGLSAGSSEMAELSGALSQEARGIGALGRAAEQQATALAQGHAMAQSLAATMVAAQGRQMDAQSGMEDALAAAEALAHMNAQFNIAPGQDQTMDEPVIVSGPDQMALAAHLHAL